MKLAGALSAILVVVAIIDQIGARSLATMEHPGYPPSLCVDATRSPS